MDRIVDYYNATHGKWITVKKTDTQYCFEETDYTLIIKFQGSVSKLDWLYNFLILPFFPQRAYNNMSKVFFVHRGFMAKFKAVKSEIELRVLSGEYKKIVVAGYSQGAAIAEVCFEWVRFNYPNIKVEGVGFGQPRVFSMFGQKVLKQRMEGYTWYENGNDIITRLPPAIFGFKHYGKKIHIGQKRKWLRLSIKDHSKYKEHIT